MFNPGKHRKGLAVRVIAGLALIGVLFLNGCEKKAQSIGVLEPQLVKAMATSGGNGMMSNVYSARIGAGDEANLMFAVSGRITDILVKEGQSVTKGTLVAKLDPRDYQNRYDELKAVYDLKKTDLIRYSILLKSNTVSRSEYDQKFADFKVAEANLDTAKKALEDTAIIAPYDGVIAKRFVEQYEQVQANQPVILIQNLSSLEVIANIPEQDISNGRHAEFTELPNGKKILKNAVTISTLPGKTYDATLKEISTRADPKTQTYQIRLLISKIESNRILPGMTAQLRVNFNKPNDKTIIVPIDSVQVDEFGKNFVWLIDLKSLTVHKKIVQVGRIKENSLLIKSGLEPGETIVIAGMNNIQEGMKVKILQDKIGN